MYYEDIETIKDDLESHSSELYRAKHESPGDVCEHLGDAERLIDDAIDALQQAIDAWDDTEPETVSFTAQIMRRGDLVQIVVNGESIRIGCYDGFKTATGWKQPDGDQLVRVTIEPRE